MVDGNIIKCNTVFIGHIEEMTKPAIVISTSSRGEICFKFRDFSSGIPGFEMIIMKEYFQA
jgi:hypothetical protein